MPSPITVPRLGWSMEEATFSTWLKADGDAVKAGEALFTLESDKATQDVEALDSGILGLSPSAPKPGDLVKVGQLIGYLLSRGESLPSQTASPSAPPTPRAAEAAMHPASTATHIDAGSEDTPSDAPRPTVPRISPRALRVATELGVDWTRLTGSGRTGRVREQDVRAAALPAPTLRRPGLSATRSTIADRLVASLRESAPVTLHTAVDVTRLVAWRSQRKAGAIAGGTLPTYTDVLIQLTARALGKHPTLNARWEAGELVCSSQVHIGLAVDTEVGLLVPVIRDVPSLSLERLSARARDLAERARSRRLQPDELRGGTFTLTSLGAYGIDAFTPIINPPECAILGIGRIQRRPAVVSDQIVARDELTLSLTFDHRALDGAPAARFLQTLSQLIENFEA